MKYLIISRLKFEKDKSENVNINNSISYMESKQLLIIIDEESDYVEVITNKNNNMYNRIENSSLSGAVIAAIIISIIVVFILIGIIIIIFRKKLFKFRNRSSDTPNSTESFQNLKISK